VRSVAAMLKPNARLMADNPLSKIPTLVLDDGFALFDSVVICEYLDDMAGGSLFPREGDRQVAGAALARASAMACSMR
jgi:glutathione S-transferase